MEGNDLIAQEILRQNFDSFGWDYTEEIGERFDNYAQLLVDWNQKINLTAITEPNEIVIKHFLDSLLLLKATDLPKESTLIDVGTGAGFPSLPVCILRHDLHPTLLDSLNKRLIFLEELCSNIKVDAQFVHARAEEAGQKADYREKYDVATARAVAHLRELAEYCLPFVKEGGIFAALKGYEVEEELEEAKYAISQIGGKVEAIEKFELPGNNKRSIVVIRKFRHTPAKYPRITAKIKKSPLIYKK